MKDLSIITVTHNSEQFIQDQIFSVIHGAPLSSLEQIVVDNGSTDQTCAVLDQLCHIVTKTIKNKDNVGFSVANNQALQMAQGRYVLFLNPDMCVQEKSLDQLVAYMDAHPDVGICSVALVDAMGFQLENSRQLPRFWSQVKWLLGIYSQVNSSETEMVKGAFMFVRKEFLDQLGFAFDPRYFLLFEDADLCREAKRMGYKIIFHPEIQCTDFNSRSFALKSGEWIYRAYVKSMLLYFRKWERWPKWWGLAFFSALGWVRRK